MYENDLYVTSDLKAYQRVTFDGKPEYMFNGLADWAYEGSCIK